MTQIVHLVIIIDDKGYDRYAVFSTIDKAIDWASTQNEPCIITPFVVDVPEYGESVFH